MGHRTAIRRTAVGVIAAAALWVIVPVASVELDEGSVPPVARAPLPAGAQIVQQDLQCGSGGCWHELLVSWPGHTSDELRADLRIGGQPPAERCQPASLLDRRKVCVFEVVTTRVHPDGQVLISERWNRPLGL